MNKYLDDTLEFCDCYKNVYVFGAGMVAKHLVAFLEKHNKNISGVLVSEKTKNPSKIGNFKVLHLDSIILNEYKDAIILGVAESKQSEIEKIIRDIYPKIEIFKQRIYARDSVNNDIKKEIESGFFAKYRVLNDIGEKYHTDKTYRHHDYCRKYEMFLQHLSNENFLLLELGVYHGGSIRMWEEYFKNARIVGVDIDESCRSFAGNRKEILIRDLSSEETLLDLAELHPMVVIDDASHLWSHQVKALFILWNSLPSGGIYILEDIETSFPEAGFVGYDDLEISAYDVCALIAEVVTSGVEPRKMCPFFDNIKEIGMQVEMITFIEGSCIMIKQ